MSGSNQTRIWIGIILILAGLIFLLENYVVLPFEIPYYFRKWEWILILIGIVLLITSRNKTGGIILVFIGSVFLWGFHYVWPFLLLVLGLFLIIKRNESRNIELKPGTSRDGSETKNTFDDVSIFGGGKKNISIQNLRGGKITAIFGGSEIHLNNSTLAKGTNIVDIVAIFGGSSIHVPADWNVEVDIVPILGGFSDERVKDPNRVYATDSKLVIKGFVLFGGGDIKTEY